MIATTVDAEAVTSMSSVGIELPSWTLVLPFVVLATVLLYAVWQQRERVAGRELGRRSELTDPGSDWATLVSRQSRRYAGRVTGVYVVFMTWLPLGAWDAYADEPLVTWWPLLIFVGYALGPAAGRLRPVSIPDLAAQVAVVRRRQLVPAACVIAVVGMIIAGLADCRFVWVRGHVVTRQHG